MKLLFSLLLCLFAIPQQPVSQVQNDTNKSIVYTKIDQELIVKLVNEYRGKGFDTKYYKAEAVAPLVWDETLAQVAFHHCMDMDSNNFSGHIGSDGSDPGERLRRIGYRYNAIGENVGVGNFTETRIISAWIQSPGHRETIMNAKYRKIGVARVGDYWTMLLSN